MEYFIEMFTNKIGFALSAVLIICHRCKVCKQNRVILWNGMNFHFYVSYIFVFSLSVSFSKEIKFCKIIWAQGLMRHSHSISSLIFFRKWKTFLYTRLFRIGYWLFIQPIYWKFLFWLIIWTILSANNYEEHCCLTLSLCTSWDVIDSIEKCPFKPRSNAATKQNNKIYSIFTIKN